MLSDGSKRLSNSDKVLLINDLLDGVADEDDVPPLSQAQEKMLDDRVVQFFDSPEQGK